jgi:anthranilate phosphoribosyltransferase
VADARRAPRWQAFVRGTVHALQEAQGGSLATLPDLPTAIDAASTAAYIRAVLDGAQPLPEPIARQVQHLIELSELV